MVYRKNSIHWRSFETAAEDGAKTRELIRDHIDVDQIKQEFPTYTLDENYLTKLKDIDPDAKALDIEAMLAAELKIRLNEDPQAEPLSEKLKRIIDQKRNGALQGIALIAALERLAGEVVGTGEREQEAGRSIHRRGSEGDQSRNNRGTGDGNRNGDHR